ncbi:MAG: SOS response-associated peptidase family protein [Gammaproteobacteria bacterium]
MCGRFNVIDSPQVRLLVDVLNIELGTLRFAADVAPGALISIVKDSPDGRCFQDALWWLMLEPSTLQPNYRYASFNSRSDKLNTPSALGFKPYRESRCIIPASAFIEGLGDRKTYHKIELLDQAIAFGGLCKHYVNEHTGESKFGASIITLGPLAQWQAIHPKSMPLMLPCNDKAVIDAWLDPANKEVDAFQSLLIPQLNASQRITPIGRPSKWDIQGEPQILR